MAKKAVKKEVGWDKIGAMIGKKIEKEFKKEECIPWHKQMYERHQEKGGFFGRALFVIGVLIALNALGLLPGPSSAPSCGRATRD